MTANGEGLGSRVLRNSPDMLVVIVLALLALLLGALAGESAVVGGLTALLVLVLPGYALYGALTAAADGGTFSQESQDAMAEVRTGTTHAERTVLALALSVALVVLGSLVLNALPSGMTRTSWRILLAGVTVALAIYAVVTRTRGAQAGAAAAPDPAPASVQAPRLRDFALLAAAAIVLGVALGLGGVGAAERPRDPFTQFWALPRSDGSTIEIGIRNDEGRTVTYHLYAYSGELVLSDEGNIRLDPGAAWHGQLPLAIQGTGTGIDLLLYRDDAPLTVYRSLRIAAPGQGAE